MKTILLASILLTSVISLAAQKNSHPLFWSPNAHENRMTYEFYVQFKNSAKPSQELATAKVEKQVTYLFGALSNNNRIGTPKNSHQIHLTNIQQVQGQLWQVNYQYNGTVEVQDGSQNYQFYLPIQIDEVYKKSITSSGGRYNYPCGDNEHWEEEYYWYFFNPTAYQCPLQYQKDYAQITAQLNQLANTKETYPEYERLVQNGILRMDILFGMNDNSEDLNPLRSKDLNADAYRKFHQYFLKRGYQVTNQTQSGEVLTKQTASQVELEIHLYFGPNSLFSSVDFQKHFADAIANSSLVIYAGHSGLGDYLSLSKIREVSGLKIQAPLNKYQIYFFNGCSTYPYYNEQYFSLKKMSQNPKGTKNLDIITNGLATLFQSIVPSTGAVVQAIEQWTESGKKTSYQDIILQADSQNLIAINGDEDNN